MECIKKLHDTVETLDTLGRNCLNCIKCLMQICTASVVRHIMPLPTLFLASEFYSDISSVDRIVSDSLMIPWWFVSGYATQSLPKQPLTFIYCLIYPLLLDGGSCVTSGCKPAKRLQTEEAQGET